MNRARLTLMLTGLTILLALQGAGQAAGGTPCVARIDRVEPAAVFVGETIIIHGQCLDGGETGFSPNGGLLKVGDMPLTVLSQGQDQITARVTSYSPARKVAIAFGDEKVEAPFEIYNWIEPSSEDILPGRIDVQVKPGVDVAEMMADRGGVLARQLLPSTEIPELADWWAIDVNGDTMQAVRDWAADDRIVWAEPATRREMAAADAPNDPCYPSPTPPACPVEQVPLSQWEEWGEQPHGEDGQWGVQRIQAEGAWAIEPGEASVKVVVMDTGVNSHPDLSNVSGHVDYTGSGTQDDCGYFGLPTFRHNHGTRVASVIGASRNNSAGIAGIADPVSILSYKVLHNCFTVYEEEPCDRPGDPVQPELPPCVWTWVIALLEAAGIDEVAVVNMSFGGKFTYSLFEDLVISAVSKAGVVMVAAAGNDDEDMDQYAAGIGFYPAAYNDVIAVAATAKFDERSIWENNFWHFGSNYGSSVGISAPGSDIISALSWPGDDPYQGSDGTSFASPMVAGVAALLASRGFFACEIVETITGTDQFGNAISADPIAWSGGGVGRLNAQKALEWWGGGPMVSDTVWPEGAIIHERGSSDRYVNNGGMAQLVTSFDERNDQCVPPAVFDAIGDPDGDGWINSADNCPYWPNASQQLPPWSVPVGDVDCDGYSTTVFVTQRASEEFIGTDPIKHCAATTTPNDERGPDFGEPLSPWTPDINDDGIASLTDVLLFAPHYLAIYPDPAYSARFDWNGDLRVTLSDVNSIAPFYLLRCD